MILFMGNDFSFIGIIYTKCFTKHICSKAPTPSYKNKKEKKNSILNFPESSFWKVKEQHQYYLNEILYNAYNCEAI